ncbi:MAG: plastocyanin/azurin family copper-binding protein [Candidatus Nitrosopumilus limneticus]|nr:Blue (Type 1) copper domain protein [Candidatus Nitrosopumilus limneticus]MDC4212204.1 plastocyanin/azurin family copper-binding protein [Candidatus Nitrosopumilus limneticus]MDC4214818.1 plastocyanin/azurin family copper-binding protein [Candidatus Nitrosopumilus limneticus]MDC4216595.1 plastocyanin/azurin family copper-binding protein [Candidatus Nitrosopumilus limneticus]MDC4218102.1 plastocyanin/azurin family copper-binding protein [Candidatus Nitrosopumilus limneticus]
MIKKIIPLVIVLGVSILIIGIYLSSLNFEETDSEEINSQVEEIIIVDVVMPIKVSRPGCDIEDICYIPSTVIVEKGKSVTWLNEDSSFHSVTSGFYGEPSGIFDSGYLDPYQYYTLSFDEYGTYDYFCTLHPWMKAQVIVK